MQSVTQTHPVSKKTLWASYIMSALPLLLLLMSAVMKLISLLPSWKASLILDFLKALRSGLGFSSLPARLSTRSADFRPRRDPADRLPGVRRSRISGWAILSSCRFSLACSSGVDFTARSPAARTHSSASQRCVTMLFVVLPALLLAPAAAQAARPGATTGGASNVTFNSAALGGRVDPNGAETTYFVPVRARRGWR